MYVSKRSPQEASNMIRSCCWALSCFALAVAVAGGADPTASPPAKQPAPPPAAKAEPKPKPKLTALDMPTSVTVKQVDPIIAVPIGELTTDTLPAVMQNAVALTRPLGRYPNTEAQGVLHIECTADVRLFIAVTWVYDSNMGAAAKAELWTEASFPREGWLPFARIQLLQADGVRRLPQVIYYRPCKRGDKFSIRTRRFSAPTLFVAAADAPPLDLIEMKTDATLPEVLQRDFIAGKAYALLQDERYDDLEKWTDELLRTAAEFPSGHYQIRSVTRCFQTTGIRNPPQNHRQNLPRLEAWLKRYPESNAARLVTASVLIELANLLRWQGKELDVMAESLRRALELLFEVEKADKTIPHMYLEYMLLARAEGWDEDLTTEYFERAVGSGSWCPQAIGEFLQYELGRTSVVDAAACRKKMQGFVEQAVAATRTTHGDMMYAAAIKDFDYYFPEEPFIHQGYEWPRLKRSFEQLVVRYPDSKRALRAFLKLSATAGDRTTARGLFDRLGPYDADDDEGWDDRFEYTMNQHWAADDYAVGDQRKLIELSVRGESGLQQTDRGLLVLDRKGWIHRLDPQSGKIERIGTTVYRPTISFAADRTGNLLAVGAWYGSCCVLAPERKFKYHRFEFDHDEHVRVLAVSADQNRMAAGVEGGKVYLLDITDDGVRVDAMRTLAVGTAAADFLGFTADGETLITYTEGKVQLWSFATGEPQHAWQVHSKRGWASALSPDGKTLALTCNDKAVRLYEIPSGKLLAEVSDVAVNVGSMAFSDDATRLALGLGRVEGTTPRDVIVVDLATKSVLATLKGHKGSVLGLSFLDDGKKLLSVANDRSARVWDVPGP